MNTATLERGLSSEQIAQFHREGYLALEGVLGQEDLQPVIDDLSAEVGRRAQALHAAGELKNLYEKEDFRYRLAKISKETEKLAIGLWNDSMLALPAIFELIRNPKLLDLAESLCGSELIASSVYRLRPKIPNNLSNSPVPWHQDSGYFEAYCDKSLVLTMWVALVNADEQNGCMWVMPGAHRDWHILKHVRTGSYLEILEPDLPKMKSVPCALKKGGVLLMTNMTPHASFGNNSDHVRWSMDLRYQNAALPTNAKVTKLKGEITQELDPQAPLACFPPEADFLVRSTLRPGEVVSSFEEFQQLRLTHASKPIANRWA